MIKLQTVVYDILPSTGGRCRKAVFGVWYMIGRGSRGPVVMSLASASRGSGFWRLQFSAISFSRV